MDHRIDFENMQWEESGIGVRSKSVIHGNQRLRLVEFSEGFTEQDWCLKGHAGIVLEGAFALDFSGKTEKYVKGDILFIPSGKTDRHKAVLGKGEKVTLLLFEALDC